MTQSLAVVLMESWNVILDRNFLRYSSTRVYRGGLNGASFFYRQNFKILDFRPRLNAKLDTHLHHRMA